MPQNSSRRYSKFLLTINLYLLLIGLTLISCQTKNEMVFWSLTDSSDLEEEYFRVKISADSIIFLFEHAGYISYPSDVFYSNTINVKGMGEYKVQYEKNRMFWMNIADNDSLSFRRYYPYDRFRVDKYFRFDSYQFMLRRRLNLADSSFHMIKESACDELFGESIITQSALSY